MTENTRKNTNTHTHTQKKKEWGKNKTRERERENYNSYKERERAPNYNNNNNKITMRVFFSNNLYNEICYCGMRSKNTYTRLANVYVYRKRATKGVKRRGLEMQ
jgi:hypothetical protein